MTQYVRLTNFLEWYSYRYDLTPPTREHEDALLAELCERIPREGMHYTLHQIVYHLVRALLADGDEDPRKHGLFRFCLRYFDEVHLPCYRRARLATTVDTSLHHQLICALYAGMNHWDAYQDCENESVQMAVAQRRMLRDLDLNAQMDAIMAATETVCVFELSHLLRRAIWENEERYGVDAWAPLLERVRRATNNSHHPQQRLLLEALERTVDEARRLAIKREARERVVV